MHSLVCYVLYLPSWLVPLIFDREAGMVVAVDEDDVNVPIRKYPN